MKKEESIKNWLILGGSGLLGNRLHHFLKEKVQNVISTYNSHPVEDENFFPLEFDNVDKFNEWIHSRGFYPDVIVNTIALTNVDKCEDEKKLADFMNHNIVEILVEWISKFQKTNVKLVQISTDQIQDGSSQSFNEDQEPNPLNYYGLSKLNGEIAALKSPEALICRTNFFGEGLPWRSSFSDWIMKSLQEEKEMTGFSDVRFSPLHLNFLSDYIFRLVEMNASGVFHLLARDSMSKYDFICAVANHLGYQTNTIKNGKSTDFPARVKRPLELSMSVEKLEKFLGNKVYTVQDGIEQLSKGLGENA